MLVLSDYILLYPAFTKSSGILFNTLFLSIMLLLLIFLIFSIYYISSIKDQYDPFLQSYKSIWGFLTELNNKVLVVPVLGLTV